jgi:hypothetical protein
MVGDQLELKALEGERFTPAEVALRIGLLTAGKLLGRR